MKPKFFTLLTVLLFSTVSAFSQSVGISDKEFTVHPSAMLEIQSSNKGVLIPRVTYTQRMYIQTNAQAAGLLVYQTDREAGFYYFDGLAWKFLAPQTPSEIQTLATVATTGDYEDLKNKPLIPTRLLDLQQDDNYAMYVTRAEKEKWNTTAVVNSFSGSYNDLTDKPTIPTHLQELMQDENYYMTVSRAEKDKWNSLSSVELFSGSWNDLLNKPKIPTMLRDLTQDDEYMTMTAQEKAKLAGLRNFTFDGSYKSLTDQPFIPTKLSDLQQDENYSMYVTKAEKDAWNGKSNFSGSWLDLTYKPVFASIATTGSWLDLQDKPTIPSKLSELQQDNEYFMTVTRSEKEQWSNVRLRDVVQDQDYAMYVTRAEKELWNGRLQLINSVQDDLYAMYVTKEEKDRWNNVSNMSFFSGEYEKLTGKPSFHNVAFSGNYGELNGTPQLHAVAISGSYEELTNKPTIPTMLSELAQSETYQTVSYIEKSTWNNKSNFNGKWENLENRPSFAAVATSGSYKDLVETPNMPEFGDWSDLSELEIGTLAAASNNGSSNKFARIDHVHTIANDAPTQTTGTSNQTIVNTAMLHTVLITGFGNVDASGSGNGDIISGGYESGSTKYKLNIRPNVILSGKPKLEDIPDYSDSKTVDYIATTKYLAQELAALKTELADIRAAEFSRQLPIGTVVMWSGLQSTIPNCWEIVDDMDGRFPVGIASQGSKYLVGRDVDTDGKSGEKEIALEVKHLPDHSHMLTNIFSLNNNSNSYETGTSSSFLDYQPKATGGINNPETNKPHENRPPFYGVYFIKKTSHICI